MLVLVGGTGFPWVPPMVRLNPMWQLCDVTWPLNSIRHHEQSQLECEAGATGGGALLDDMAKPCRELLDQLEGPNQRARCCGVDGCSAGMGPNELRRDVAVRTVIVAHPSTLRITA